MTNNEPKEYIEDNGVEQALEAWFFDYWPQAYKRYQPEEKPT